MKISRLPDGDKQSDDFIDAFTLLSDGQQIGFMVEVAEENEELRELMLAVFRKRGLLSVRREADLATIGGRLKFERERLGFNQTDFAALASVSKAAQISWEKSAAYPNATCLADFAQAGVDVLFVVTGRKTPTVQSGPDNGHELLQALKTEELRKRLGHLDPFDRRTVLLALFADELRG